MPFVSATRLRLRSLRFLIPFLRYSFASAAEAERAEGFIAGDVMVSPFPAFWTVTCWRDGTSMGRFRNAGKHAAAMEKLAGWCDEASVVHWTQEDATLPTWIEAHRRMVAEGRLSRVERPSARQAAGEIPPPASAAPRGRRLVPRVSRR